MVRDKGGPSPRPRPPDIECISDDVPRGENGRRRPAGHHPALVLVFLACVSTRRDGARSHRFLHGIVGSELDLLLGER